MIRLSEFVSDPLFCFLPKHRFKSGPWLMKLQCQLSIGFFSKNIGVCYLQGYFHQSLDYVYLQTPTDIPFMGLLRNTLVKLITYLGYALMVWNYSRRHCIQLAWLSFSGMTKTKSCKEQDGYSYHSMDSELSNQYH